MASMCLCNPPQLLLKEYFLFWKTLFLKGKTQDYISLSVMLQYSSAAVERVFGKLFFSKANSGLYFTFCNAKIQHAPQINQCLSE